MCFAFFLWPGKGLVDGNAKPAVTPMGECLVRIRYKGDDKINYAPFPHQLIRGVIVLRKKTARHPAFAAYPIFRQAQGCCKFRMRGLRHEDAAAVTGICQRLEQRQRYHEIAERAAVDE
jgi:hypothetical protein